MSDIEPSVKTNIGKKRMVILSDDEDEGPGTSVIKEQVSSPKHSPLSDEEREPPRKVAKTSSKVAPIFAPKEKKEKPSPKTSSTSSKAPTKEIEVNRKGEKPLASIFTKATLKPGPKDDGEVSDEVKQKGKIEEEEDAIYDEIEDKQEGEAAVKLASIFTKNQKSVPVADKGWKDGEAVPYPALVSTFEKIEATTKRLEILEILTQFLLVVAKRDTATDAKGSMLLKVVYLCINRLCPDYIGIELGIGESLLVKAIAESTGRAMPKIKEDLKREGDLGKVAMNSRNTQSTMFKPKPLTVPYVFQCLTDIAKASGNASQTKKVGIIKKLLAACQGTEAKFIIRSLEGKLRIGLADKTVVVALAHAIVLKTIGDKKPQPEKLAAMLEQGAETVKAVYSELPSYDLVIPALLQGGVEGLREHCKLTPGVPLKPMLAKPTKAITEVLDRFEGKEFTCEYKYDGERAQVHLLEDGTISVFSRNSENMSAKYPDLVDQIPRAMKPTAKTFVIDAEAVAYDLETKKILPFQDLSRRKRKDVKAEDITVRVHIFAFDLLYLNGESLLAKELKERRQLLQEHFQPVESEFAFAKSSDGSTTEEIQALLEESVKDGCEGLMVKMLTSESSTYEPSRRSMNWLKLKKDYLSGVGDSLDLVVIGAYHGKGKRTAVYGAFLLACYDPDSEHYQTICKIGTGFSEEILAQFYEILKPLELEVVRGDIEVGGAKPDVWFEPRVVWEVLTADLSLSPIYAAAHGVIDSRGISLRFPRFIRIRDDKSADEATTAEQVSEFYQRQVSAGGKKGAGADVDDFW
ncbi:DNA ligase 1 [Cryptococcus neoformans C23]|uniref:DNA ligase n=1 Tax=Cryptococcus neoformans (strain H99 / ATCC 208821 / CBS 10515 / FGSC 9487) TaxID=235443 RepID=J9VRY1_CRYN9|nr:DNA ligase 1 [Cryptococcus neoformans var. grubii H99]AUB26983.1 DNA ligase 1 [Cryptococcus neoformans var. grubii]OWZ29314.1 DNA ligase 1 [Cryptococcus neoformans var. grubii AD2-60a]OWZ41180.1 DNA ligase 1 [Cryptococcus neoformans var. grubii C23]OXC82881.1 DNA ligase 1 [Cryptococcus neoformans var. grubii AD1-7a]OXG29391.1 DNA ligase 1 [Cryptococcus neoformans var. grubii Bt15]OXG37415.1 DNA ligase 1 [Cryptococcus neoformans var. grubii Bt120]OXG47346.1 DNA ligase 1 [Cryptococcus neofo|eukprot:XP_012051472.1 DNA ligase 1 [Cryptococcus neoformans var. grubii H99]